MLRTGRYFLMLAAAGLSLAACRRSEVPSSEIPDGSFEVSVEGMPQEMEDWDCIVYSFKGEDCVDVAEGSSKRPATVLSSGERMNVIASDRMEKFVIGARTEGLPLSSYFSIPRTRPRICRGCGTGTESLLKPMLRRCL